MKNSKLLERPIIIIGSPRSGTTMVGHCLEKHPDIVYWEEPRSVWMLGNAYSRDDELQPQNVNATVRNKVIGSFAKYVQQESGGRFCEKTPS
ncbi:MAG: sulfotransferase, partial [Bacteroidales bacterium]|nr:sulfotransferase [Bacteroidales bacterium]